jgi:hypothetical protein
MAARKVLFCSDKKYSNNFEKSSSTDFFKNMQKINNSHEIAKTKKHKKAILLLLKIKRAGKKITNLFLIHHFPVHPGLEPVILRKPF